MISRLKGIFNRGDKDPDCGEVRDLSSDYIDGDLDVAAADRVKGHLDWCGPCNAFVNTLRATVNMLGAIPGRKAPDGFRQSVREKLKADRGG